MSSFTVGGLSTGINYNDLISKLLEIQRQPIYTLESKKSTYNGKINTYGNLLTRLSTLESASDDLRTSSNFYEKTASVSDSTVLEATASSSASVGNYSISITGLASEEKEVHSGVASSTTVVNNSGSDKSFQYTYAGTQRTLTVADGTTLEGLRTLINSDTDNPGVTATIVNDGSSYRLIITGDDTGSTKTITIDSGTTLDGTDSTVDFTSTTFTENKTAGDASFTVDSLSITRSSNTVTDVISGVTITLKNTGSGTISVTADEEAIKEKIESFVSAYNDVVSFISSNSAYDSTTEESGILSGEGTAKNIQNRLRSIMSNRVSGLTEELRILAQIGITTDTDSNNGTLSIDSSTLEEKLASNLEDVANLFTDTGGIAVQIYDYVDSATSSVDGSITLRKDGLKDMIDDIDDIIRDKEYRLEKVEQDLIRKFTALEMLVSSFNTQGNFLTNQTATLFSIKA